MVKNTNLAQKKVLIVFSVLAIGVILVTVSTDVFQLFSVATLSLDATNSQGNANERGVDASTGHFRGKGFKGQDPPPIPTLPPPTTDDIIDSRVTGETQGEGIQQGGGAPASTIGLSGFQELIRDEVLVFDRFHTPAKGQTITGSILFEWGNENPITIDQILISNEFNSWFEFETNRVLMGEGLSFDGRSDDEIKYTLTIPENTLGNEFTVPIRFIIDAETTIVDANALVEIEIPSGLSQGFSFAEFIRSLLAGFR